MTNEVSSLSRVYKFLSQKADWAAEADGNGDGAITKAEFSKYLKENFEWNGEEDSQKTDLINSFWKSIDTNKSTAKIKGTRVRNNNALDKKEQEAMSYRLEMYETLNTFLDGIKAPTVLSSKYATQWKTSVDTSLSNITETAIKGKKTTEELQALLEEQTPLVQAKATADYCATEYLETTMKTISQKYSYAYGDDNTLKGIIDAYVQSLHGDETATDMQSDIQDIIDAYLATAGLADDNGVDLEQYGYVQNDGSELNDLQKCVAKKALQDNLASIKDEADYADYSSYYDEAVNAYIESVLSSATFATFDEIQTYGVEQFKASDEYATVTTKVKTKKLLASDALREKISSTLSSELADNIQKNGRYISAFDEITNQAIEKAANGEFDTNGTLDEEKLLNWVVDQVSARLTEFYPNGLKSMTVKTLKSMYTTLTNAASKETDNEKSLTQYRNAALQVCEALYNKGDRLKEAVTDIFGDSYAKKINELLPGDIDELMTKLLEEAEKIGDPLEYKATGWSGFPADGSKVVTNTTINYNVSATVEAGDNAFPNITYSVLKAKNCTATISDLGALAITTGDKEGNISVQVAVLIDNMQVGTKTITLQCQSPNSIFKSAEKNWGSWEYGGTAILPNMGQEGKSYQDYSFEYLYDNNAIINLEQSRDAHGKETEVRTALTNLLNGIVGSLKTQGLDGEKLERAKQLTIDAFMGAYHTVKTSEDKDHKEAIVTTAERFQNNKEDYYGIVRALYTGGKDYQVNAVRFRDVVDTLLKNYASV